MLGEGARHAFVEVSPALVRCCCRRLEELPADSAAEGAVVRVSCTASVRSGVRAGGGWEASLCWAAACGRRACIRAAAAGGAADLSVAAATVLGRGFGVQVRRGSDGSSAARGACVACGRGGVYEAALSRAEHGWLYDHRVGDRALCRARVANWCERPASTTLTAMRRRFCRWCCRLRWCCRSMGGNACRWC